MSVSKVILNGNTLMDATTATAEASDIASPKTAMLADGVMTTGTGTLSSGYSIDDIINRSFSGNVESDVSGTYTGGAFRGSSITSVQLDNVTTISAATSMFENCKSLVSVSMVKLKTLTGTNNLFAGCTSLTTIDWPLYESASSVENVFGGCTALTRVFFPSILSPSTKMFNGCTSLKSFVAPKLNSIIYGQCFIGCTNLEAVDFLGGSTSLSRTEVFKNCSSFTVLVIRKSDGLVNLGNINNFTGTPFASGGVGGTIYIPKSLYDHLSDGTSSDYKAATNWSTIDGYGTITWAKIEGSYYETHYVDGTEIPTT